MTSIREVTVAGEGAVMEVVDRFYHSPAVEYEVDLAVFRRPFQVAVDPAELLIQSLMLGEDGRPVDYHYMCIGYPAEVGGRYLLPDELYLAPECRGKGYGEQVIRWAVEQHPECARYRLEVTGENWAARLYERMGFRYLDYKQMVIDWQKGVFGMTRVEETETLRVRTDVYYNCCQLVLVSFADLCGLDKETAFKPGVDFSSDMRHGPTCGAVTGALMMLGLAGKGADEATVLMRRLREKDQAPNYANLLRSAKEQGEERKCHCNWVVYEVVELLEELLGGE